MHPRRRRFILAAGAIGIAVAVVLTVTAIEYPWLGSNPNPSSPPTTILNATVSAGPTLARHLASPFFAVVFTASNLSQAGRVASAAFLNSTPITWIRYDGSGEGYDPTTQTVWEPPSGGGSYVPVHEDLWNLTWFRSWCYSLTPHCAWLGYLPGQINNTQAAIHTAEWYHSVLGMAPNEWELSNEPELWSHFGTNYSQWTTQDALTPTGPGYATMVQRYIAAVSALYPSDRYVGIEAACAICDHTMVPMTAAIDGAGLSAMAYHSYPTAPGSTTNLADFYAPLEGPQSISSTFPGFRTLYTSACSTCANLSTEIGEYQAGPPMGGFSPFASQYAGAVFLGASVIQALETQVSSFTVFNIQGLYNAAAHTPTPEGLLYQRILANMTMGSDRSVNVTASGLNGVFAILVNNQTRSSFFLVNTNLNTQLNLSFPSSGFPAGGSGSMWTWSPGQAFPVAERGTTLPLTYTVPPQGILLLDNF